jgi:hypothetical protein
MKIFISAPREKEKFIKCVKEVAHERNDEVIFCPDQFRELRDKQLLDKVIRELETSHLVLMDVSMKKFDDEWYPNPGVMIEFGLVVKDITKGLGFVYMFCDQNTDRNQLPPLIPRIEVIQYSEDNEDELKNLIRTALQKFEKDVPEMLRQALQAKGAIELVYRTSQTSYTR